MRLGLAVFFALCVVALRLVLNETVSFEALSCDSTASCFDLWMTCQGEYVCSNEPCSAMWCRHAADEGPRHGGGFVVLAAALLAVMYALIVGRMHREAP